MGNSKSKMKPTSRKKAERSNGYGNKFENAATNRKEEYDDPELVFLRKTMERNPEMFVLNNLMMCVQFFGNYEE